MQYANLFMATLLLAWLGSIILLVLLPYDQHLVTAAAIIPSLRRRHAPPGRLRRFYRRDDGGSDENVDSTDTDTDTDTEDEGDPGQSTSRVIDIGGTNEGDTTTAGSTSKYVLVGGSAWSKKNIGDACL